MGGASKQLLSRCPPIPFTSYHLIQMFMCVNTVKYVSCCQCSVSVTVSLTPELLLCSAVLVSVDAVDDRKPPPTCENGNRQTIWIIAVEKLPPAGRLWRTTPKRTV